MYYDVIMTGFGGQGIQTMSLIAAISAINKGLEVTYLPSYGVEKRGGRTDVTVIFSDEEIGSPITNSPLSLIAMDTIGLEFYQPQLTGESLLIANTSLIPDEIIKAETKKIMPVKLNDESISLGNPKLANMITLGCFIGKVSFIDYTDVENCIEDVVPKHLKDTVPENLKAIKRGIEISENWAF